MRLISGNTTSVDVFGKKGKSHAAFQFMFCALATLYFTAFLSCSKQNWPAEVKHQVVLLEVNYLTHRFEGGKIYNLTSTLFASDTIPVLISSSPANDFGNLVLIYAPTGDTLFAASTVWQGTGKITIPDFIDSGFSDTCGSAPLPPESQIHYFPNNLSCNYDYRELWDGICHLKITFDDANHDSLIGTFLYTPSLSINGKKDWHCYFVFYK